VLSLIILDEIEVQKEFARFSEEWDESILDKTGKTNFKLL
jgi:hypothetical protein